MKPEVEDSSLVSSSKKSSIPTNGTAKIILQFNTVDEAEAVIKDHEASYQYRNEHFYPGLVYTGTYRCPCGTTITWWDQKLKDGFDEGDSDDPRVRSIMGFDIDENSNQNSE